MAEGVRKSLKKNFKKYLCTFYDWDTSKAAHSRIDNFFKSKEVEEVEMSLNFRDEKTVAFLQKVESEFNINTYRYYKLAVKETEEETYQAMEALIHNLCTMQSRYGGQVPFSSINYGLDTTPEGRLVMKQLLLATQAGLGNGETPIFPIQIFRVKEGINFNVDDPNYDLFELACETSTKRLFPNFSFMDAPINKDYYDPEHDSYMGFMGCVHGDEVVIFKYHERVYVEPIRKLWDFVKVQNVMNRQGKSFYVNTADGLKIWDSHTGKFVVCKKVIKNPMENEKWIRLKFSNGRSLVCTLDHPLPVKGKGRIHVSDLVIGDEIPISKMPELTNVICNFDKDFSWFLGLMLCDGCYQSGLVVSIGLDELELVDKIKTVVGKDYPDLYVDPVIRNRGRKGNYCDVIIHGTTSNLRYYLSEIFDGVNKIDRSIPSFIFSSLFETRLAFLCGMIDADGHIQKTQNGKVSISLGSTNKVLALQQMLLAESLGYKAKLYLNYYKKDGSNIRYLVSFEAIPEDLLKFLVLKKKKEALKNFGAYEFKNFEYVSLVEREFITDYSGFSFDVETESDYFDVSGLQSHNCRTRIAGDVNALDGNISLSRRGNLSFTTINLPRLALKSMFHFHSSLEGKIEYFFLQLNAVLDLCHEQLLHRYKIQCNRHVFNFPFLMGQGLWFESEKLDYSDTLHDVLKHGTLSIGFIGLAETLSALIGSHHGESEDAQKLGLAIVQFIQNKCVFYTEMDHLNFSCLATPAEGLAGRFVKMDRGLYGSIDNITDRDYYTNSFHVPVWYPISVKKKLDIEAPYHSLTPAGHISYIELNGDLETNPKVFMSVIKYMKKVGISYGAINHPVDMDPVCGYTGIINDVCPYCGRREYEEVKGWEVGKVD